MDRIRSFYEHPGTTLRAGEGLARVQAAAVADALAGEGAPAGAGRENGAGATIPGRDGPLVVDVGCGDGMIGGVVQAACATRPGAGAPVVLGTDWSEAAVRAAQRAGLRVVQATPEGSGLPLADAGADVVLMSEVIEHLVDPDTALEECRRILRPGGTLVVSTPNLAAWYNRALLVLGVQPVFSEVSLRGIYGRPGSEVVGHLRLFTRRALVGLLEARGFVDVTVAGAPYDDVPVPLRPLDRLLCHIPSLSSLLVARCRRPA
jgi:SAM-dependent methyltransferase